RGEFTLVVEGASREAVGVTPEDAQEALAQLRAQGVTGKDAVARVATTTGLPRRVVYDLWLGLDRER
ncbi:MAG: 16S rRNA (cytidine(1402)-2'-O)-methyltransferase, partial [Chloroflexota bacterium]